MHKRKSKPDLMFLLTVFVCLGVVVTTTVKADAVNQQGWAMTVSSETNCPQTVSAWQNCAAWQGINTVDQPSLQRAAISFFHEDRPNLGVVWYYSQEDPKKSNYISNVAASSFESIADLDRRSNGQFGVALRQQYRHFGFSVGIESEQALPLNNEATLFFGISNSW